MDELTLKIIDSLVLLLSNWSWPLVLLILLGCIYRKPIVRLILKSDWKIKFSEAGVEAEVKRRIRENDKLIPGKKPEELPVKIKNRLLTSPSLAAKEVYDEVFGIYHPDSIKIKEIAEQKALPNFSNYFQSVKETGENIVKLGNRFTDTPSVTNWASQAYVVKELLGDPSESTLLDPSKRKKEKKR